VDSLSTTLRKSLLPERLFPPHNPRPAADYQQLAMSGINELQLHHFQKATSLRLSPVGRAGR
jgi:hypothetical protein